MATHSLQSIHWWASDVMLNFLPNWRRNDLDGMRVSNTFSKFHFWVNYFFKTSLCFCNLYLYKEHYVVMNYWLSLGLHSVATCFLSQQYSCNKTTEPLGLLKMFSVEFIALCSSFYCMSCCFRQYRWPLLRLEMGDFRAVRSLSASVRWIRYSTKDTTCGSNHRLTLPTW